MLLCRELRKRVAREVLTTPLLDSLGEVRKRGNIWSLKLEQRVCTEFILLNVLELFYISGLRILYDITSFLLNIKSTSLSRYVIQSLVSHICEYS
jgi:hypothetical protein